MRPVVLTVYAVFSIVLFFGWGALVRRGRITGRNILWSGFAVGLLAMGASALMQWPDYAARKVPLAFLLLNVALMGWVTVFCVVMLYRNQRSEDIATFTVGDTKIIVRVASISRIPDAQAMLLPNTTNLKMADGVAGLVSLATGSAVQKELSRLGPVGMGKVVQTGGGDSKVGRIFHVAVSDALKPVDATQLRKGIEAAAQQARKASAESIVAPIGPLRGLPVEAAAEAIIGGVLRQRKAFAEIVFLVLEGRHGNAVRAAAEKAVASLEGAPEAGRRSS